MGSQRVGVTELLSACTHAHTHGLGKKPSAERQGRFLECSPLGRQGCDLGCVDTTVQSTLSGKSGRKVVKNW